MANNMEFNPSEKAPNKGISGFAENTLARAQMNRFAYGNQDTPGFLESSIGNTKSILQEMEKIDKLLEKADKTSKNMTDRQRQSYKEAKTNAELLKQTLEKVESTGVLSQTELSQLIKDTESTTKNAVKALQLIISKTEGLTDDMGKKIHINVEAINTAIKASNEIMAKNKQEFDELEKKINRTQDSLTKGIGETLTKAGDKLASLANMFNLQSIANNTAEQNARSKLVIQREVSTQLGLGSNTAFENFKNSLNDSLKSINSDMGSLFNAEDLNTYMSNMSQYGITSVEMAQQQLKATIMGNKYLGVSTETQQQVFKYMKRTNNNDALNEHNRMIVGLLNSQLGISKQQLDVLSQKSYSDAEVLAALDLDEEGQARYIKESMAAKSTMESINKGWRRNFRKYI